jgi:hypothetical protein
MCTAMSLKTSWLDVKMIVLAFPERGFANGKLRLESDMLLRRFLLPRDLHKNDLLSGHRR